MRSAAICLLCLAATAAPALAAGHEREPTEVRLDVTAQDYADPASLYDRLRAGAERACDSGMGRNLAVWAADRDCARQVLDKTVRRLGKPVLAAIHAQAAGKAAPATAVVAAR